MLGTDRSQDRQEERDRDSSYQIHKYKKSQNNAQVDTGTCRFNIS